MIVQVGLSGEAAKRQAKGLARMRANMVRSAERAEVERLRTLLKGARRRRREALQQAATSCRRLRLAARVRVRELRARELAALRQRSLEIRGQARAQCQARQHRIKQAGHGAAERVRRQLLETQQLQAQLRRLELAASRKRARLVSRHERLQESDDAVRSNLPPELQRVWAKVKRTIKTGPRTTRTEAFLEWAEANPEEVLALQSHDAEREVRQLVKEYERAERKRHAPRKTTAADLAKLEAMGLAPNRATARKHARAIGWEDPPF